MSATNNRPVIIWLLSGCVLIFLMVIIGGITRLTHSGLSMVEWNIFMGALPPLNEVAWLELFQKYQRFPEFNELNYDFTLDDFKGIFWWEYIHRMLGRLIGLVFIVPFIYFLRKKMLTRDLVLKCILMFLLGGFQGFLGWFMVRSGLIEVPRVSHIRIAAHLVTAFLTAGYVWWVVLGLIYPQQASNKLTSLRKWSKALFFIIVVQIIYGAFVAGLRAGMVHNTFPLMDGVWIADAVTSMKPVITNFIEGRSGVQFVHRYSVCCSYCCSSNLVESAWKAIG